MFEWVSDIVALTLNPVSLLIFLIVMKYARKERKKADSPLWESHQGRGA
jgi:hypothetical protein